MANRNQRRKAAKISRGPASKAVGRAVAQANDGHLQVETDQGIADVELDDYGEPVGFTIAEDEEAMDIPVAALRMAESAPASDDESPEAAQMGTPAAPDGEGEGTRPGPAGEDPHGVTALRLLSLYTPVAKSVYEQQRGGKPGRPNLDLLLATAILTVLEQLNFLIVMKETDLAFQRLMLQELRVLSGTLVPEAADAEDPVSPVEPETET